MMNMIMKTSDCLVLNPKIIDKLEILFLGFIFLKRFASYRDN